MSKKAHFIVTFIRNLMFFTWEMLAHPFNYFSLGQHLDSAKHLFVYSSFHKMISHYISIRISSSAEEINTSCGPLFCEEFLTFLSSLLLPSARYNKDILDAKVHSPFPYLPIQEHRAATFCKKYFVGKMYIRDQKYSNQENVLFQTFMRL